LGGYARQIVLWNFLALVLFTKVLGKTFGLCLWSKSGDKNSEFEACERVLDKALLTNAGSKWLPTNSEECYGNAQFELISIGYNQ
jgi:hypothetical protein